MINQVILVGNLGRDPETKYMPSGSAVTNFSIATTKRWKKDGEQKEHTEWHNIATFGKLAEVCAQYLRKGAQVYIQGELRTRKWEKNGENHYSTEIIADTMKMLGKKREGDSQGSYTPPASKQDTSGPGPDDFDDDIPF